MVATQIIASPLPFLFKRTRKVGEIYKLTEPCLFDTTITSSLSTYKSTTDSGRSSTINTGCALTSFPQDHARQLLILSCHVSDADLHTSTALSQWMVCCSAGIGAAESRGSELERFINSISAGFRQSFRLFMAVRIRWWERPSKTKRLIFWPSTYHRPERRTLYGSTRSRLPCSHQGTGFTDYDEHRGGLGCGVSFLDVKQR